MAEGTIKIVVNMSRTMMLHATLRLLEGTIKPEFLPVEMYHAVWLYNRILNPHTVLAPIGVWYHSICEPVSDTFSNCRVWGYPTYMLGPKLHKSGFKIPKCSPRFQQVVNFSLAEFTQHWS